MLRMSSFNTSTFPAHQVIVGAVQPFEHLLLFRRQVSDYPVQEQGCLIQQPFRRLDALHHHDQASVCNRASSSAIPCR